MKYKYEVILSPSIIYTMITYNLMILIVTPPQTPIDRENRGKRTIDLAKSPMTSLRAHLRINEVSSLLESRRNFSNVKHTRGYSGVVSKARNEKSSRHVLSTREEGSANNPHRRFAKSDLFSRAMGSINFAHSFARSRSRANISQPCPRGLVPET